MNSFEDSAYMYIVRTIRFEMWFNAQLSEVSQHVGGLLQKVESGVLSTSKVQWFSNSNNNYNKNIDIL